MSSSYYNHVGSVGEDFNSISTGACSIYIYIMLGS